MSSSTCLKVSRSAVASSLLTTTVSTRYARLSVKGWMRGWMVSEGWWEVRKGACQDGRVIRDGKECQDNLPINPLRRDLIYRTADWDEKSAEMGAYRSPTATSSAPSRNARHAFCEAFRCLLRALAVTAE